MLEIRSLILFFHILSFTVAFGLVTLTDLVSFKFLRSGRKKKSVADQLPMLSKLVIIMSSLTIFSGAALIAFDVFQNKLIELNPRIQTKILIATLLFANGLFLHFIILPRFLNETKKISIYNTIGSHLK